MGSALTALEMEGKIFGEFTLTVVVYDEDQGKVQYAIAEFQKLFTRARRPALRGALQPAQCFFATLPGNRHFNLRSNGH